MRGVPSEWRARRVKVSLTLPDALPFLDVEALQTHQYLTEQIPAALAELGVRVLDVGDVRGHNRRITRAVASWAFSATDLAGSFRFAGIRYISRLDNHECWAVFQGANVLEDSRSTILLHDADLKFVADMFDLRIF